MQIQRRKLAELKAAAYNPKTRVDRRKLTDLRDSIEAVGLLYPVLIDRKDTVVDGHRRLAVAKLLGWSDIPAITVAPETDTKTAYGHLNSAHRKQSGNETLAVWLVDPDAVTVRRRSMIQSWCDLFGRELLQKICRLGLSLGPFRTVASIIDYCDWEAADHRKCLEWVIKHGSHIVSAAMAAKAIEPSRLRVAINKDKPLRPVYGVSIERTINKQIGE